MGHRHNNLAAILIILRNDLGSRLELNGDPLLKMFAPPYPLPCSASTSEIPDFATGCSAGALVGYPWLRRQR